MLCLRILAFVALVSCARAAELVPQNLAAQDAPQGDELSSCRERAKVSCDGLHATCVEETMGWLCPFMEQEERQGEHLGEALLSALSVNVSCTAIFEQWRTMCRAGAGLMCEDADACVCPNGSPATGDACPAGGAVRCGACNTGYHFDQVTKRCKANMCHCDNGFGAVGMACAEDHTVVCDSCQVGYHIGYTAGRPTSCVANTCTCTNGVEVTGFACHTDGSERCASCTQGFQLVGELCRCPAGEVLSATTLACELCPEGQQAQAAPNIAVGTQKGTCRGLHLGTAHPTLHGMFCTKGTQEGSQTATAAECHAACTSMVGCVAAELGNSSDVDGQGACHLFTQAASDTGNCPPGFEVQLASEGYAGQPYGGYTAGPSTAAAGQCILFAPGQATCEDTPAPTATEFTVLATPPTTPATDSVAITNANGDTAIVSGSVAQESDTDAASMCPTGQYLRPMGVPTGDEGATSSTCIDVTECTASEYETQAPSATSDRVCTGGSSIVYLRSVVTRLCVQHVQVASLVAVPHASVHPATLQVQVMPNIVHRC